jgi:Tol biopolymer transport system component
MNGVLLVASLVLLAVQSRKVNDPLPTDLSTGGSDVESLVVSPDGTWLAYLADQDVDQRLELYSAPFDGSAAARKLSAGQPVWGDYRISAGVQRAVFLVAQPSGKDELFSAPIDGSAAPVKLNDTLVTNGDVISFVLSPNGARVIYLADQAANERFELWSVPTDRSAAPVKVSGTMVTGGDVRDDGIVPSEPSFGVSPDGTRVVYLADQAADERFELYSAPLAGGVPPVRLNATLAANGDVLAFRISANSQRVVFLANQDSSDEVELFSVALAGGTPVKLNGPLPANGDVTYGFEIDPLSSRVAYLADQVTDEKIEVFSRPLDGSGVSLKLDPAMIAQGDVTSLRIAPGAQRVAYLADADVDGRFELYAVGLDGSAPVKLSAALPVGGNVGDGTAHSVFFSGDGARAGYWADQDSDGVVELYSVPMGGGPPTKLSGPLVAGGNVSSAELRVTADGLRVLFVADKSVDERFELWVAPIDGSAAPTKLSGALPNTGDVLGLDLGVDPSNQRVAYRADAVIDGQNRLWSASLDGVGSPHELNGPLLVPPILGDVLAYAWSPDGKRVLYVADQLEDNVYELFSKRPGSFAAAQRLSAPTTTTFQLVDSLRFDPDNGHAIFCVRENLDIGIDSAPLDGSAPPALLGEILSAGRLLFEFPLNGGRLIYAEEQQVPTHAFPIWNASTDGGRAPFELTDPSSSATLIYVEVSPLEDLVVFADLQSGLYGLHTVPVDGSTLPVALTAPLGSIYDVEFTPAGDRIVFSGQFATANPPELWSVPATGGAPVRLTPPLAGNRAVTAFVLTPDGARIVYCADQDVNDVFELYSVPIAGGASVKLSGTMTSGGDVDVDFSSYPFQLQAAISPDGTRVIYRADQAIDEVFELFSAPIDGSAPAVRLNAPLSGFKSVVRSEFLFTLDGARVVYVADQEASFRPELYLAPADGSQPAIKLTPPMVLNGGVRNNGEPILALTPDGEHILYMADQLVSGTYELFSVPLDGSQVSTRLNGPLVAGGDVLSFQLGATGDVLYLADEEHDEVRELFYTLGPRPVPRVRPR